MKETRHKDIKLRNMSGQNNKETLTDNTKDKDSKSNCPHCKNNEHRLGGSVLKWIFMIVSGSIFLGLLVWSKVSFLSLAEAMHDDDDFSVQERCRMFVMLQIILCVPHVLNFIRGVWNGVLRTDVHLAIYLAVIVFSLLESAGMCIFTFIIPGFNKTHHVTLLMSCIFLFPIFSNMIISCIKNGETKSCKFCKIFWLMTITLGALSVMNYWLWSEKKSEETEKIAFTYVSTIVLSLAWIPPFMRKMRDKFKQKLCRNARTSSIWKLTAVMSFCNIVFTIVGSGVIFHFMNLQPALSSNDTITVTWQDYRSGWDWNEWKEASGHEILLFATHIPSGIAGYMVACMICKAHLHETSFLIPLILSAPVAFLVLFFQDSCHWILARKGRASHLEDCDIGDSNKWWQILIDFAAIFCFALAHVLTSGLKFYKTDFLRHLTEEQIFRIPAFNSIFLDHWLLLNVQNKEDDSDEHIDAKVAAKRQKIFICTTMYRENAQEMEQFIKSIQNLENRAEQKTEVHIFFDDAIQDNTASKKNTSGDGAKKITNEYVQKLVTQIKTILYTEQQRTSKSDTEQPSTSQADKKDIVYGVCETPYGMCLTFKKDRKNRIIIHLKDSVKVKQKKRWSQVMYMHYVLWRLAKKETDAEQPSTTKAESDKCKLCRMKAYCKNCFTCCGSCYDADLEQRPLVAGNHQTQNYSSIEEGPSERRGNQQNRNYSSIEEGPSETRGGCLSGTDEMDSYLLVTDADVSFTSDSVEYLLDLMMRDDTLGAVCARTHPRGSGPLYWYQIFEYAVGHWFQKAAEQVLGTVLCAPGCFSIYRCKAVADVLPDYETDVDEAFDFLIKDMGEDRWFCTLMVQKGWFIEYCAAARNETFCPDNFAEFFKQRRRWLISTVANMWLLLKDWSKIRKKNNRVSVLFGIYQAMLLFASLISPSSTILLISGGIKYGWDWNVVATITLQVIVSFAFGLVCLFTSQDTQMKVAKLLTFLYAIMMTSVAVGLAVAITSDFSTSPEAEHNCTFISDNIRISTFTVFLSAVVGMFLLTGMLHIKELGSLIHGLWFFLCIPAGYLILPIYCVCNMTDKSWGTREDKILSDNAANVKWLDTVKKVFSSGGADQSGAKTDRNSNSEDTESSSGGEDQSDGDEKKFWKRTIKKKRLKPRKPRRGLEGLKQDLSEPLAELRRNWIIVFATANCLWLTFIATLAYKGEVLNIFGSNPVGLVVLFLLLILLIIQFLAMLKHRLLTLVHHVGRLSFCTCDNRRNRQLTPSSGRDTEETKRKSTPTSGTVTEGTTSEPTPTSGTDTEESKRKQPIPIEEINGESTSSNGIDNPIFTEDRQLNAFIHPADKQTNSSNKQTDLKPWRTETSQSDQTMHLLTEQDSSIQ